MVDGMQDHWEGDDGLGGMQDTAEMFQGALHGEGTGGIFGTITDWAIEGFQVMMESWREILGDMQDEAVAFAGNVNASLASIQDRTVTITTAHRTIGSPLGGGSAPTATPGPATTGPITVVVPQDAVTDSVLRAAPGREALRGWA